MGGSSTDYSSSRSYSFAAAPSVTRKSARDYAADDKREYEAPAKGLPSIVGKDISTDAKFVLAVILDQTGSMKEIPRNFINKMPTLYSEANAAIQGKQLSDLEKGEKLDDLLDIGVVAIGDSRMGEQYPFQVLPYCHGTDLVKGVLGIFPEGCGGGNERESYDLGAYYLLNHSNTPNVPNGRPVLIIAGDEGFYDNIRAREVKTLIGDDLPQNLQTAQVLRKLKERFDTFVLRPETGSYYDDQYAKIHKQWADVFGEERVMRMNSYQRMVDCIIGICGYASGNWKTSEELLRRRQTPEQVDEVLKILHPLLKSDKSPKARKSGKRKSD